MPRGNKMGPQGLGPMTGRGLGRCTEKDQPNVEVPPADAEVPVADVDVPPAGAGRGLGRGPAGAGRGLGRGARDGRGAGLGGGRGRNA